MSIKIENIVTPSAEQWYMAIRAMRLPMWSMDMSDSHPCDGEDCLMVEDGQEPGTECNDGRFGFCVGKNDLDLMRRLAKSGSDHRKFLRMLPVILEVTAPMYFLAQLDTYKVGTTSCGSSKMHKLMHKPFEFDDFGYGGAASKNIPSLIWAAVEQLNYLRGVYLESEDEGERRKAWDEAIAILPESYHQTRILSLNYEVLWSMYRARKTHKLGDWRVFCDTIVREIPYFAEIFAIEKAGE